jgi:hypothetical protein
VNKLAVVFGLVVGIGLASCRLDGAFRTRQLTGTCEGACDHYLSCKRSGDAVVRDACVEECRDTLQDTESLRAFESLDCRDTVEYVEGDSGRGPGQLVGDQQR